MDFELSEEHRMLKDLVARFVRDELMPLEAPVLAREAAGQGVVSQPEEKRQRVDKSRRNWASGAWMRPRKSAAPTCRRSPWSASTKMGKTCTPYTCRPTARTCAC